MTITHVSDLYAENICKICGQKNNPTDVDLVYLFNILKPIENELDSHVFVCNRFTLKRNRFNNLPVGN